MATVPQMLQGSAFWETAFYCFFPFREELFLVVKTSTIALTHPKSLIHYLLTGLRREDSCPKRERRVIQPSTAISEKRHLRLSIFSAVVHSTLIILWPTCKKHVVIQIGCWTVSLRSSRGPQTLAKKDTSLLYIPWWKGCYRPFFNKILFYLASHLRSFRFFFLILKNLFS